MSIVSPSVGVTLERFLAIPDDDQERELIRGEVKERPATRRNRFHAKAEATLAHLVRDWLLQQPTIRHR